MFGTHGIPARSLEMARAWDPGAGEDGADRYTRFFADISALHREHGAVLAAFREVAVHDATARGFYTADLEGFDEAVLQTLLDQQRAGSTPSDVDTVAGWSRHLFFAGPASSFVTGQTLSADGGWISALVH